MPRQNTPPSDYPQAVLQQIEKLAQNIAIARKRRGESQAQWAKRLGISQPTMARIERGDPSVAMASYVMCMWLINPKGDLAELIAPQNDHTALEREVAKAKAQRKPKAPQPNSLVPPTANADSAVYSSQESDLASIIPGLLNEARQEWTSAAPGLAALMAKKPPQKP